MENPDQLIGFSELSTHSGCHDYKMRNEYHFVSIQFIVNIEGTKIVALTKLCVASEHYNSFERSARQKLRGTLF